MCLILSIVGFWGGACKPSLGKLVQMEPGCVQMVTLVPMCGYAYLQAPFQSGGPSKCGWVFFHIKWHCWTLSLPATNHISSPSFRTSARRRPLRLPLAFRLLRRFVCSNLWPCLPHSLSAAPARLRCLSSSAVAPSHPRQSRPPQFLCCGMAGGIWGSVRQGRGSVCQGWGSVRGVCSCQAGAWPRGMSGRRRPPGTCRCRAVARGWRRVRRAAARPRHG